jgi:hypothetical protein
VNKSGPGVFPAGHRRIPSSMSSDSPERPHNYFRGQERIDLVEALALGKLTHAELADKYGRHIQTIHQFSARNHYEIAHRRQELHGQLNAATADEWVKDKAALYALYRKHYEDLDARLSDPDIDDRTRDRLSKTATSILDKVRDLKGWLTTRSTVEHEVGPRAHKAIILRTPDKVSWNREPGVLHRADEKPTPAASPNSPVPEPPPAPPPGSGSGEWVRKWVPD